jgi:hypothetical protein
VTRPSSVPQAGFGLLEKIPGEPFRVFVQAGFRQIGKEHSQSGPAGHEPKLEGLSRFAGVALGWRGLWRMSKSFRDVADCLERLAPKRTIEERLPFTRRVHCAGSGAGRFAAARAAWAW